MSTTVVPSIVVTPRAQLSLGLVRKRIRERASTRLVASISSTALSACRPCGTRAEVWAASAICPAISTPVGPAPTTTKVKPRGLCVLVALDSAASNQQDAIAEVERAVERLELGSMWSPLVVPESTSSANPRDDQHVERSSASRVPFGS